MPKRPHSARVSTPSSDSLQIFRMNSPTRTIPTHRHLLKEATPVRPHSARPKSSAKVSTLLLDDPHSTSRPTRPQSAHPFASSHSSSHAYSSRPSTAQRHEPRRRASTSLALHHRSPEPRTSSHARPQSAHQRHSSSSMHSHSSSMMGFHHLFKKNLPNYTPDPVPLSWTESSRKRQSLSMIELSLAENLKLLSTNTPVTSRELFTHYLSTYESAFDRVLEVLENSELHGILQRIKIAYHRMWTLLDHMNQQNRESLLRDSPRSTESQGLHRPSPHASSTSPLRSRTSDQDYSRLDTHTQPSSLSSEHELQSLRESNQLLQQKLEKNEQLLQFYAKKWREQQSTTNTLQGLSDHDQLLMRMDQIELEVDAHIYDIPLTQESGTGALHDPSHSHPPVNHTTATLNNEHASPSIDMPLNTNLTPTQLQNQRREILQRELEESKLRIMDIERELQSLETEDFFESLGMVEGDQIPAKECSLRDRLLQQEMQRRHHSSGSGIEVARGTISKRNFGKSESAPLGPAKVRSLH